MIIIAAILLASYMYPNETFSSLSQILISVFLYYFLLSSVALVFYIFRSSGFV